MGGFVEAAIEGGKRNKQGGEVSLEARIVHAIFFWILVARIKYGLKTATERILFPFSKVVFAEKDQSYFESLTRERERERDTSTQGLQFSCSVD